MLYVTASRRSGRAWVAPASQALAYFHLQDTAPQLSRIASRSVPVLEVVVLRSLAELFPRMDTLKRDGFATRHSSTSPTPFRTSLSVHS